MKLESLKQLVEDMEALYGDDADVHVYIGIPDDGTETPSDDIIVDFTSETIRMKPLEKQNKGSYDHVDDDKNSDDDALKPTLILRPKYVK